jgi:hypothetical protein
MLSTYGEKTIILRPNNTFENFYIHKSNFNKLFIAAIKKMKMYRENGGRL